MINTTLSRITYICSDDVREYQIPFVFVYSQSGVPQIKVALAGEELTLGLDYFVTQGEDGTGSITLELQDIGGLSLSIVRDDDFLQQSEYQLGRINNEQIEKDFDRSVMRDQTLLAKAEDISTGVHDLSERVDVVELTVGSEQTSMAERVIAVLPPQASATNQLADKEFVNSSIATSTAKFQGTYESEIDLPTEGVDDNDYAFVSYVDTAGNTKYKRYKYTEVGWAFEYELNNTSFTSEQWAAVNSGISSEKVSVYDGLVSPMVISVIVTPIIGTVNITLNKVSQSLRVRRLVGGDDISGVLTADGLSYQFVPTNAEDILEDDWVVTFSE